MLERDDGIERQRPEASRPVGEGVIGYEAEVREVPLQERHVRALVAELEAGGRSASGFGACLDRARGGASLAAGAASHERHVIRPVPERARVAVKLVRQLAMADDVVAVDRDVVPARDRAHEQRRAAVLRVRVEDALAQIELVLDADRPGVRVARVVRGVGLGDKLRDLTVPRANEVVRARLRAGPAEPVDGRRVRAIGLVDHDRGDLRAAASDREVPGRRRNPVNRRVIRRRRGLRGRRRERGEGKGNGEAEDEAMHGGCRAS